MIKKSKKKFRMAKWLPLILLAIALSNIAYARTIPQGFMDGLAQINNFFANENYRPYAKTIDFAFFSLLLISIYLIGVRRAFPNVGRSEKSIAILLGLMSAFLLVVGGYSTLSLLKYLSSKYIKWVILIVLFIFFWISFGRRRADGTSMGSFKRLVLSFLSVIIVLFLFNLLRGNFDKFNPNLDRGVFYGVIVYTVFFLWKFLNDYSIPFILLSALALYISVSIARFIYKHLTWLWVFFLTIFVIAILIVALNMGWIKII